MHPSEVGGCFMMAGGDTKSKNGNGNAVFIVRKGVEWQEIGNGRAIEDMVWYWRYIWATKFDSYYANYHLDNH